MYSYYTTNETLRFGQSSVPALTKRRVSLVNYTQIKQATDMCKEKATLDYNHSILGITPYVAKGQAPGGGPSTVGASFRQDLLTDGRIQSKSMSLWFDKMGAAANSTIRGTVLFGAVPQGKYSSQLTKVKLSPPDNYYVGYYIPTPKFSATTVKGDKSVPLTVGKGQKNCLVDSGTGIDSIPVDEAAFLKATGLVMNGGYPAWPGPCSSIPANASLTITVPGATQGKYVTIKVPYRNYARGISDYLGTKNKCSLSMEFGSTYSCVFAAPSNTAMFMAVSDDTGEFAMAQGGISKGAAAGTTGLGKVTMIKKGGVIPGAV